MTLFDDNPASPLGQAQVPEPAADQPTAPLQVQPLAGAPAPDYARNPLLPEDLQISWSWSHLVVFVVFGFVSLIVVQLVFAIYYAPHQRLSQKQYEHYVLSKPQFAVGSMLLWYALIFLFLYVTLAVLRGLPFWRSLGWRKLNPSHSGQPGSPWTYFFSGCGLSILVFVATAKLHTPEHAPIYDILKYRNTALLFMAMAVFVAPLVEETIFRGYLYPLLARSMGVAPGVIVTGVLFGLLHGYQLGWTLGLVSALIFVGVVLTFVRARSGTVFASFLLHLGYNSTIAFVTILGTKGFTQMPPGH